MIPAQTEGKLAAWRWMLTALCLLAQARVAAAEFTFTQHRNLNYAQASGEPQEAEGARPGEWAQQCDVLVPDGAGPFPGVLVVHGGAWMSGDKSHMLRVATALAEHGYTVCSINYRLAPKHPFPAQIDDCKLAVRWLRSRAQEFKMDPKRLRAYGYSAGGQLVALLGVTDALQAPPVPNAAAAPTDRLQCIVAGGAPCDFRSMREDSQGLIYWLGGTRAEKPAVYEQASPLGFVTADDPPSFFFHGEADRLVPPTSARKMVDELTTAGVTATFYPIPAAGHINAFFNDGAMAAGIEFLDKHLQPDRQSQ